MRHKVKKVQIGTDKDHRTALLRNLAMSVIIHEKIKTTVTKAKAVQPFVEKLITSAKKNTEKGDKKNAIRELDRMIQHEDSSKKILEVLIDRYKDRNSGYTRITKLGFRKGDNAPLVQLELV